MSNIYSGYECTNPDCKRHFTYKNASGLCPICRKQRKKNSRQQKECALEECHEIFFGGGNQRYCLAHKGMSKREREVENDRIRNMRYLESMK